MVPRWTLFLVLSFRVGEPTVHYVQCGAYVQATRVRGGGPDGDGMHRDHCEDGAEGRVDNREPGRTPPEAAAHGAPTAVYGGGALLQVPGLGLSKADKPLGKHGRRATVAVSTRESLQDVRLQLLAEWKASVHRAGRCTWLSAGSWQGVECSPSTAGAIVQAFCPYGE